MCENESGPTGASTPAGPGPQPDSPGRDVYLMVPTPRTTGQPTDRMKLTLVRSIAGHADGRETEALAEIQAALDGATLEELAALRGQPDPDEHLLHLLRYAVSERDAARAERDALRAADEAAR